MSGIPQELFLLAAFFFLYMGHNFLFISHNFLLKHGHFKSYYMATRNEILP